MELSILLIKELVNIKKKYDVNLEAIMGITDDEKTKMSEEADIILCTDRKSVV